VGKDGRHGPAPVLEAPGEVLAFVLSPPCHDNPHEPFLQPASLALLALKSLGVPGGAADVSVLFAAYSPTSCILVPQGLPLRTTLCVHLSDFRT
jgi:hypothetical protein